MIAIYTILVVAEEEIFSESIFYLFIDRDKDDTLSYRAAKIHLK